VSQISESSPPHSLHCLLMPLPTSHEKLVFLGDMLLLFFYICFVLLNLLRSSSRWKQWQKGHILRSVKLKDSISTRASTHSAPANSPKESDSWSDRGSNNSEMGSTQGNTSISTLSRDTVVSPENKARSFSIYWHARSMSTIVHPIVTISSMSRFPIGRVFVWASYTSILLFLSVYRSNMFTDPVRCGFVAASQIPFVFVFAMKNNILGISLGVGYQKVITYPFNAKACTNKLNVG
jgi:ferric-chelate reductase